MALAEIITTGEEVINGELTDTNARWISQRLIEIGVIINRRVTVGDRIQDLVNAFEESSQRADMVIVNGGLGPTVDDISAQAAALALGEPRQHHEVWVETLEKRYRTAGREMSPNNLDQANLPVSAQIIDNPIGTACGFSIQMHRAVLYFTPGVPPEMKRMMTELILPSIRDRFPLEKPAELKKLHCFGLAESNLDALFSKLTKPKGLSIGFRAHFPIIQVKLTASNAASATLLDGFIETLPKEIREFVVGRDEGKMETTIGQEMQPKKCTLALAESCTGGLMAKRIVDIPGSSAFFLASFVTYTNASKTEILGVKKALIEEFGAVSLEVAEAMAQAARVKTGATHALSISGIAGPSGGTDIKPVGTICVALATPHSTLTQMVNFPNFGRQRIRLGGAHLAFDMLRRHLQDLPILADYTYIKRLATKES